MDVSTAKDFRLQPNAASLQLDLQSMMNGTPVGSASSAADAAAATRHPSPSLLARDIRGIAADEWRLGAPPREATKGSCSATRKIQSCDSRVCRPARLRLADVKHVIGAAMSRSVEAKL